MATTAYDLAARIDFNDVDNFVEALKRMRTEAERATRAVNDLGGRTDRTTRDVNRFDRELRRTTSSQRAWAKILGFSNRDLNKFTALLKAATTGVSGFALVLVALGVAGIKGAKALGAYSRELAATAAIGNTTTTTVQAILNGIRPLNGTMLEAANIVEEFNERLGEFTAQGSGPAKTAIAALGISTKQANGELRDTPEVLAETVAALRKVRSASQQSALSVQLFGEQAGAILSAALRENSRAFDGLTESGRTASNMLSDNVVKAANAAHTAIQEAAFTLKITFFDSVSELSPALERFGTLLERLAPTVKFLGSILEGIGNSILILVNGFIRSIVYVQDTIKWFGDLVGITQLLTASYDDATAAIKRFYYALPIIDKSGGTHIGVQLQERDDGRSIEETLAGIPESQRNGTNSRLGTKFDAQRIKDLADAEKAIQTFTKATRTLRLAAIDDVILREKERAKFNKQENAAELLRINALKITFEKKAEVMLAANKLEIAQQEKIAALEKARDAENKKRLNLFGKVLRGDTLSQTVQNTDNTTKQAFEARKSALNEYLNFQINSEYDALDKLLIETKASNSKRLELERSFGKKISADRLTLSKQIAKEELELEKKLLEDKRDIAELLQRQDNNLFANSSNPEAKFAESSKYQKDALARQIQADREALEVQLSNFERHESEKAAIRAKFEADANQRRSNLNKKLEDDSREAIKTLLAPATSFFEELAVGYAKSKNDGEQSWKAVRDSAIQNLQEILTQQLANAAIQQALSFGLSLFGGAAGAATSGAGGIAQGNGVTTFPTSTPQATPIASGFSTRSKPTGLQNDAPVTINMSIEGNATPAETQLAAQQGTEAGINNLIDRRIIHQKRSGGTLASRR